MISRPLSNTQLVFFNQYRQLCVYNTYSNIVTDTFLLLKSDGNKQYIRLQLSSQDITLSCSADAPDPTEYSTRTYQFNNTAGMIWLDIGGTASIVVGMGDIRDLTTNATIHTFAVPADASSSLIIECKQAYHLRIHYKGMTMGTTDVPATTIQTCN